LDDLNLPTTFYFSTDFVDNNAMSWIDKLEYCLETKKRGTVYIPWLKKKVMFATVSSKINLLKQIRFFVKNNLKFNIDNFVESFFDDCKMKKVSKIFKNLVFETVFEKVSKVSKSFEKFRQVSKNKELFKAS
jgi:hypothetical protein